MSTSVSVLGSTGSIGTQTLEIIRKRPGDYVVTALGVGRNPDVIAQAEEFRPQVVAVADAEAAAEIGPQLPEGVDLLVGDAAMADGSAADGGASAPPTPARAGVPPSPGGYASSEETAVL